jgi:hypothetical protein
VPGPIGVKVPKSVRNAFISIFVLLFLFVGAGVAYTWYSGQSGGATQAIAATPAADTTQPLIKPRKPAANAKESVAIESLTTPVAPGANSSLIVRTLPTSKCTISVVYNNVASTDSGLVAKVADDYGNVSWSWTVSDSTPVGHAPVTVTCAYNGQSAVVQGDLVVTK